MHTLTLCMITRDEEAILPGFLRATAGLWDELCVVDTGSVDATTDIIRMAGGRVQSVLWNDDFALARNTCFEMASSEWVIVLDADELIDATLVQSARSQLSRADRGACMLPFVSMSDNGDIKRVNHLRMFRRHPALRYQYRLHEDVVSVTEAYLTRTKLGVGRLLGHVTHLGESPERQAIKGIKARNRALIASTLHDNPFDVQGWYEKLRYAQQWEDVVAQQAVTAQAMNVLDQSMRAGAVVDHYAAQRLIIAVSEVTGATDPHSALQVMRDWEARTAPSGIFYVSRADRLADMDMPSAAAADYDHALCLAHTSLDVQAAFVRPLVGLARLLMRQGDFDAARTAIHRALSLDARDPLALRALASLSETTGGEQELVSAARNYIDQYGECRERQAVFAKQAQQMRLT